VKRLFSKFRTNEKKNLAIVFADICGSTALYESRGNEAAFSLIANTLKLLGDVVNRHGGRVIKTVGDEVMCSFPLPDKALLACSSMQASIRDNPWDQSLRIRIGLNYGEIIEKEGDVFGDCVNVAARLSGLCNGGQILTSADMLNAVSAPLRASARRLSSSQLRGKVEETSIFEVIWDSNSDLTTMSGSMVVDISPVMSKLELEYGNTVVAINNNRSFISLGRDPGNLMVVESQMVSRFHAEIALRNEKFYLRDRSANGTFVQFSSGEVVKLLRDELILVGSGTIGLGKAPDSKDDTVVFRL
jgi:class 3 adenylate cyclase